MPEYFSLPELRALPDVDDTTTYPDARVEVVAASFVALAERHCGVSFLPRAVVERHDGSRANECRGKIVLRKRRPLEVTALTQDGTAFTAGEIAELVLDRGVLWRALAGSYAPVAWNPGIGNLLVTYNAGFATVPGDVKEAALEATREALIETSGDAGMSRRRKTLTTDAGTFDLSLAGTEHPTGYPPVDAVLNGYRRAKSPLVS